MSSNFNVCLVHTKKKKIVFSLGHGKKKVQLCKPFNFLILTALKKF